MQMALSRGANGFRREAGGVDEPARATDVFYALSPTSPVARCSFSPVKDTGMRFAESSRPTIAIRGRKNSAAFLSLSLLLSRDLEDSSQSPREANLRIRRIVLAESLQIRDNSRY